MNDFLLFMSAKIDINFNINANYIIYIIKISTFERKF